MTHPLNILVVEDHDDLRDVTVSALQAQGHTAQGVDCAEAMDEVLANFRADIVLLDLNLPGEDGLSIARRLRAAEPGLGIIMVTARDNAKDVMAGYEMGADIYVAKPASPEELNAAIRALARRLGVTASPVLELDLRAMRLHGPKGVVDISHQEGELLAALARAADHRQETWQMLERIGKQADEHEIRALAVQIVRLRKKLEQAGASDPTIKAIRGVGYQLCIGLTLH